MKFTVQFSEVSFQGEVIDDLDLVIPGRTISVREAAFKYMNGIPLDAYLRQPTDIPLGYDRFDILDRGAAYRRDLVMRNNTDEPLDKPLDKPVEVPPIVENDES